MEPSTAPDEITMQATSSRFFAAPIAEAMSVSICRPWPGENATCTCMPSIVTVPVSSRPELAILPLSHISPKSLA